LVECQSWTLEVVGSSPATLTKFNKGFMIKKYRKKGTRRATHQVEKDGLEFWFQIITDKEKSFSLCFGKIE
jgi:hypothetical protein